VFVICDSFLSAPGIVSIYVSFKVNVKGFIYKIECLSYESKARLSQHVDMLVQSLTATVVLIIVFMFHFTITADDGRLRVNYHARHFQG
jgi:hypothetical protein